MEASRWQQIKELFSKAAEIPESERQVFLQQQCGEDFELRNEVSNLLGETNNELEEIAQSVASSFINDIESSPDKDDYIGQKLGVYQIKGVIGQGGMGTVYKALRADDEFQQQVAIKLIRANITNKKLIQRFHSERQILANLNHPNIASLIDGGSDKNESPFIVMEYINGLPILEYCQTKQLSIEAKIELFKQVASAVSYAHQNLVVHRDIKPENILVTAEGQVKLLDFGIAKIISEDNLFDGDITQIDQRVMTPYYASPEQLSGLPITTSTDVYSLGVLLFQLLTGVNPYYRVEKVPASVIKAICETDPLRPSAAVLDGYKSSIEPSTATNQKTPIFSAKEIINRATAARKILAGELDSIVLKSMQKKPADRYHSVEHLLNDLLAYQNDMPISAQPDNWSYRSGKFIQRNKLWVLSLGTIFVLSISSAILLSWQSIELTKQKNKAQIEAEVANQTSAFMVDLFRTADPRHAGTQFVTARDLLDTAVEKLRHGKIEDKGTRARLLLNLGLAYQHLDDEGSNELGVAALRESLVLTESEFGRRSLQSAEVLQRLGDAIRESSNDAYEALELLKEGLDIRLELMPVLTDDIADSYNNLSLAMLNMGRMKEAEVLNKKAIQIEADLLVPNATSIDNLGGIFEQRGLFNKGLEQAEKASILLGNVLSKAHDIRGNLYFKVRSFRKLGRFDEAIALLVKIAPLDLMLYGPNSNKSFFQKRETAQTFHAMGKLQQASTLFLELEQELEEKHSPESSYYDLFYIHYGLFLADFDQLDKGTDVFTKGYGLRKARWGDKDPLIDTYKIALALLHIKQSKFELANKALNEVLIKYDGILRDPDLDMARTLGGLAQIDLNKNQKQAAQIKINQAKKILKELNLDKSRLMQELNSSLVFF